MNTPGLSIEIPQQTPALFWSFGREQSHPDLRSIIVKSSPQICGMSHLNSVTGLRDCCRGGVFLSERFNTNMHRTLVTNLWKASVSRVSSSFEVLILQPVFRSTILTLSITLQYSNSLSTDMFRCSLNRDWRNYACDWPL